VRTNPLMRRTDAIKVERHSSFYLFRRKVEKIDNRIRRGHFLRTAPTPVYPDR
jgi:hypothetical protein